VDDVRAGRILRVLRLRLRFTQAQLASKVGLSQSTVSLAERGHFDRLALGTVRTMFAAVEARYDGVVSWRGGGIDRLLDEHHARLVGATAARLRVLGWDVDVEVTFNDYGDRGSIDILAVRATDGVALVVEIKTELTSVEETLRRLSVKERLAAKIVFERSGLRPVTVGRLVVLLEGSKNRRRVQRHAAVLDVALQDRGLQVRTWLRMPIGRLSGLLFSSPSDRRGTGHRAEV
jgi:transcriptional regulator with XRE-family HTH domain